MSRLNPLFSIGLTIILESVFLVIYAIAWTRNKKIKNFQLERLKEYEF